MSTDSRPVPLTISQHYDRAPEEYWHEPYFEERGDQFSGEIESFRRLWKGTATTPKALDIGAGVGKTMESLRRAGFEAWGLEPSGPFRERAIERGIAPERLKLSSLEEADYPASTFDLITFGAVLEHMQDPAVALKRAVEWLAPNGQIYAEVPSARWLIGRMLNLAYRVRGIDYVTNLSPMHSPYHLYEFELKSFQRHGATDACGSKSG